jgi:hypothetical protein
MSRPDRSPLATAAIDAIWCAVASRVGFRIERTHDAYASSRDGVISIGADDTLDPDDALAQLIFHELCHAITEGRAGLAQPDWGLDNVSEHVVREHACLRVQAEIADRFGLREVMAPTTEYRAYHDALPARPLAAGEDAAISIAAEAVLTFDASSWRMPIEDALAQTVVALGTGAASVDPRHPVGFALGPAAETCGSCAWLYVGGRGAPVARCRQSAPVNGDGARTDGRHRACVRWEPAVDCQTCGACCREAYHSVTVSVRDPVVWKEPQLIERHGHRFEILREGARCAALEVVATPPTATYACTIYENRPKPCREFAAGGRHCLEARRRVGLSAGP